MSGTLTADTNAGQLLDHTSVDRILSQAATSTARVTVSTFSGGTESEWSGVFLGCHGPFLSIKPDSLDPPIGTLPTSSMLRVQVAIEGITYSFETRPLYADLGPGPGVIHLERPRAITQAERRRSSRRHLRQPTEVTLSPITGDPDSSCKAVMLNVSPDGLACRVARSQVECLDVGSIIQARFRLEHSTTDFDLCARVCNVTEGGTPGHAVVGIEFTSDDRIPQDCRISDRVRLRESLECHGQTGDRRYEI